VRSLDAPDSEVGLRIGRAPSLHLQGAHASVAEHIGCRALLLPLPFAVWRCLMTPILVVALLLFLLLYRPTRIPVLAVLAVILLVWLVIAH
jgi:hypothetical protein